MTEWEAFAVSIQTPTIVLGMLSLIIAGIKAAVDLLIQLVNIRWYRRQLTLISLKLSFDLIESLPVDEGRKSTLRRRAVAEVDRVVKDRFLGDLAENFVSGQAEWPGDHVR